MPELVFDTAGIDFESPGRRVYEVAFHLDGQWGYVLLPLVVIGGSRGPGKCVACFGGTHGDEYEGQVAIRRLMHELPPEKLAGRLLLIPRLNPPACESNLRESPLDGVNMNRAFPGDPSGTITSRIAHFVASCILPRADVVLDLHAGGAEMDFAPLTSFHLVEDPERRMQTRKFAALFDTPFMLVYSRSLARGLLVEQAERQGCVAIGGEFGHGAGISLRGMSHVHEGIRNLLKALGMIPGDLVRIDGDRDTPPRLVRAVDLADYVPAPISGVFEPVLPLGSRVEAGQLVGRLHDFERLDAPSLEIRSRHAGYLVMNRFRAPVRKGSTLFVVAEEEHDSEELPP